MSSFSTRFVHALGVVLAACGLHAGGCATSEESPRTESADAALAGDAPASEAAVMGEKHDAMPPTSAVPSDQAAAAAAAAAAIAADAKGEPATASAAAASAASAPPAPPAPPAPKLVREPVAVVVKGVSRVGEQGAAGDEGKSGGDEAGVEWRRWVIGRIELHDVWSSVANAGSGGGEERSAILEFRTSPTSKVTLMLDGSTTLTLGPLTRARVSRWRLSTAETSSLVIELTRGSASITATSGAKSGGVKDVLVKTPEDEVIVRGPVEVTYDAGVGTKSRLLGGN